jgi:hypothetical protein
MTGFHQACPLNKKLLTVTSACNLVQVINQSTVPGCLQILQGQDYSNVSMTFLLIL